MKGRWPRRKIVNRLIELEEWIEGQEVRIVNMAERLEQAELRIYMLRFPDAPAAMFVDLPPPTVKPQPL